MFPGTGQKGGGVLAGCNLKHKVVGTVHSAQIGNQHPLLNEVCRRSSQIVNLLTSSFFYLQRLGILFTLSSGLSGLMF